ncbi:MAG: 16S rRNA (guanine(966)-N(2))-methyltransferase RsmD [Oceanicaulis sp.]
MRIVAGAHRGRPIAAPKGLSTRPTTDRVRESVFNKLAHAPWAPELEGARVIDLFAGSGALGLEAISRGAAFCLFVETEAAARGAIRTNVETLQLYGCTKLHRRDATDLGRKPEKVGAPFDLAFADPPYGKGLGERALEKLAAGGWLKPGAIAVLEESARAEVAPPEAFTELDALDAGETAVRFFRFG